MWRRLRKDQRFHDESWRRFWQVNMKEHAHFVALGHLAFFGICFFIAVVWSLVNVFGSHYLLGTITVVGMLFSAKFLSSAIGTLMEVMLLSMREADDIIAEATRVAAAAARSNNPPPPAAPPAQPTPSAPSAPPAQPTPPNPPRLTL